MLLKAAVRGGQYIKSFLAPIARGMSHRVLPFHDSFNNMSEDGGSPSRRNSESSDDSNRSLLHHYMEMMPEAYRPTDMDFDEGLMATYQEAVQQMHAYSVKIKSHHHHHTSEVVVPFFEASTKDRAIDTVNGFDRSVSSSLVLKDIEDHHSQSALLVSPKSVKSVEV
jgi:hypothetical protein